MNIMPVGKRKNQIAQIDNSDFFMDRLFEKTAIQTPTENGGDAATQPVDPGLQSAMNQSGDAKMNAASGTEQPNTEGEDFAIIAQEFSNFLRNSEKLQGTYIIESQHRDQKNGKWTLVIAPAQRPNIGPSVTKGGPPFSGGQQLPQGNISHI